MRAHWHVHHAARRQQSICSHILTADVSLLGIRVPDATLVNDAPVHSTDGYVGLGFLRAFDILLTDSMIGFRRSGRSPRDAADFGASKTPCKAPPPSACDAARGE